MSNEQFNLTEDQKLFAIKFIEDPQNPFDVAVEVLGNRKEALQVYHSWSQDPEIRRFSDHHIQTSSDNVLVSNDRYMDSDKDIISSDREKNMFVKEVRDIFFKRRLDPELKYKYAKLIGDWFGLVQNPVGNGANIQINNIAPPVMKVVDKGTDDSWEQKLAERQKFLTDQSAMPIEVEIEENNE